MRKGFILLSFIFVTPLIANAISDKCLSALNRYGKRQLFRVNIDTIAEKSVLDGSMVIYSLDRTLKIGPQLTCQGSSKGGYPLLFEEVSRKLIKENNIAHSEMLDSSCLRNNSPQFRDRAVEESKSISDR